MVRGVPLDPEVSLFPSMGLSIKFHHPIERLGVGGTVSTLFRDHLLRTSAGESSLDELAELMSDSVVAEFGLLMEIGVLIDENAVENFGNGGMLVRLRRGQPLVLVAGVDLPLADGAWV